jgi:hypothetical protein
MTIFLGVTETFNYPHHHIRSLSCGPGGHILASLSESHQQDWILSLWLLENGLHCFHQFSFGQISFKSSNCLTAVIWHPCGQYLYVVIGGNVTLVSWELINSEKRMIPIIEFFSSFLEFSEILSFKCQIQIMSRLHEADITSLILLDDGQLCVMGCLQSYSLLLSHWKLESIHYLSVTHPLPLLSLLPSTTTQLIFHPSHEIQSDLDSTHHGQHSESQSLFFLFPSSSSLSSYSFSSSSLKLFIGLTSNHTLCFFKYRHHGHHHHLLPEPQDLEISSLIRVDHHHTQQQQPCKIFQMNSFEENETSVILVCLAYHEHPPPPPPPHAAHQDSSSTPASSSSSLSLVDVDILIIRLNSISTHENYSLSLISRTSFVTNLSLSSHSMEMESCHSPLHNSSILFLQSTSPIYATPDLIISLGDRVIGYRLDLMSVNSNSFTHGGKHLLSTLFVINTSHAGISSSLSDYDQTHLIHMMQSCIVANRLVTTCTNEGDESVCGTVIHATSLLVDLTSSLRSPLMDSSGVLFNATEKQLYLFNLSNSHYSAISADHLPSFASFTSPLHSQQHASSSASSGHSKSSSKLAYKENYHFSQSDLPVFPSQGALPYIVTKLPKSLQSDLLINSCGWETQTSRASQPKGHLKSENSDPPSVPSVRFHSLMSSYHLGSGLILAREHVGGIYFACTLDTSTSQIKRQDSHEPHLMVTTPLIWLHSLQTTKWKLIQPHRYPASVFSILFLSWRIYERLGSNPSPPVDTTHPPHLNPKTRKQYFLSKCELHAINRMIWFGNHTLVLCSERGGSMESTTEKTASGGGGGRGKSSSSTGPRAGQHYCLELMTRKTIDPIIVKQATHRIPGLPMETRRITFPHLQCIIPLPWNFVPTHLDLLPTKSHVDHSTMIFSTLDRLPNDSSHSGSSDHYHPDVSFHSPNHDEEVFQLRRSINRAHSGVSPNDSTNNGKKSSSSNLSGPPIESQDSCYLLLGSSTRFIALHLTATTHLSDDEMSSIAGNTLPNGGRNSNPSRRKYSNTTNFQDFVSFYPSSYRVAILWDVDITSIPLHSPTLVRMHFSLPIQSAFISCVSQSVMRRGGEVPFEESTHSSLESTEHSDHHHHSIRLQNDVSFILLDREGKVVHISPHNVNSIAQTYDSIATVITLGSCSSITRLRHDLLPVNQQTPSPLQEIYYLHSHAENDDEALWLPHAVSPNHNAGGVIMSVFKRTKSSVLFAPPTDNFCSYLSYSSPLHLIGLSSHSPNTDATHTQPTLSLHQCSLPLIMLLSLINTSTHYPSSSSLSQHLDLSLSTRHSSPSFLSQLIIPLYTYRSTSTHWMKYLLSHLSLNPLPLQRLTDGLELILKSIINRSGFTRNDPDFAVLTSILFSSDDVLFIEIISRLSRKLEPHISASLFPLPNYQVTVSDHRAMNPSSSSSSTHKKAPYYRGVVIRDSPWDQLTLFELCLSRCALQHAARFLMPACEQLGGSQSLESITASLILSHELLLECFRHLQLECALECLEFCMRLDVMAAEVHTLVSHHRLTALSPLLSLPSVAS